MRIHYLQHVPFEDLGSMEAYFLQKNARITCTKTYQNQVYPALDELDWLIVLGGPMSVNDDEKYPWLIAEKAFIKAAIESNKIIIGICLGAQLVAEILGAYVTKNKYKEIGWHNLSEVKLCQINVLKGIFKLNPVAFHWHGDTFSLPEGTLHLAKSNACENQAFSMNERIFGFQFHLETTQQGAQALIKECANELSSQKKEQVYIQTENEILNNSDLFKQANLTMANILDEINKHHQLT